VPRADRCSLGSNPVGASVWINKRLTAVRSLLDVSYAVPYGTPDGATAAGTVANGTAATVTPAGTRRTRSAGVPLLGLRTRSTDSVSKCALREDTDRSQQGEVKYQLAGSFHWWVPGYLVGCS